MGNKSFNIEKLDVFADKFTTATTSYGAAGLWRAANVAKTPREKIDRWAKGSLDNALKVLSLDEDAGSKGYSSTHAFLVSRKPIKDVLWAHIGISFVIMSKEEVRTRFPHLDEGIKYGVSFSSYTLESRKFLPYLMTEIEKLGGKFIQRKIISLDEISHQYDVIINCSGLGARELVDDKRMFGTRGQVLLVKAPWVKECVYDIDIIDGNVPYVIPNIDHVVLGGTKQNDDNSLEARRRDREWIQEHASKLVPSVSKAEIISEWVGMRPGRDEVRLELEMIKCRKGRKIPVIHNYGHGANGITLSWGCGENVMELLEQYVQGSCNTMSKL